MIPNRTRSRMAGIVLGCLSFHQILVAQNAPSDSLDDAINVLRAMDKSSVTAKVNLRNPWTAKLQLVELSLLGDHHVREIDEVSRTLEYVTRKKESISISGKKVGTAKLVQQLPPLDSLKILESPSSFRKLLGPPQSEMESTSATTHLSELERKVFYVQRWSLCSKIENGNLELLELRMRLSVTLKGTEARDLTHVDVQKIRSKSEEQYIRERLETIEVLHGFAQE